ncbi:MAG TPA: GNAT family N-acetyltransferase [Micromonosporaceae bacterium]|nr:GNAT family N-acetyltransferase [Micromonosporaceae bacterium]
MADLTVRPAAAHDRDRVTELFRASWGRPFVVGHGVGYDLTKLPTLVAVDATDRVTGVLTYTVDSSAMQVVSIEAATPGTGAGGALLSAAVDRARALGLRRLWLVTTNDNLDAVRFYQRRGLRVARVAPGAVDQARRLAPTIPTTGAYDIPMRDELTMELRLDGETDVRRAGRAAVLRHAAGGELALWSLLGDPVDAVDAVRALTMPHLGRVDAVTGYGEAGMALAALAARELEVALVQPGSPAAGVPGLRLLLVDPGVSGSTAMPRLDAVAPFTAVALLVDGLPAVDDGAVPVTALVHRAELTGAE